MCFSRCKGHKKKEGRGHVWAEGEGGGGGGLEKVLTATAGAMSTPTHNNGLRRPRA